MALKYETIVNGMFQQNCYLVWDDETMTGVFIDPGDEPETLLAVARERGVAVEGILNTHGHFDHVGAVSNLVERLSVPVAIHRDDKHLIENLSSQPSWFGLPYSLESFEIDVEFSEDKNEIKVGNIVGKVLHTPGHSPGGVCFLFDRTVFVGDTLFSGSFGRTDLPGGDMAKLSHSIKTTLMSLPDDTIVLSGHGPATTIGQERISNPMVVGAAW